MLLFQARVDLGEMAMKGYYAFPKAPALLELHHQIALCYIQNTHLEGCLTPLQRCNQCILQFQPTGPQDTHWGCLTPLQRCNQCILQPQLNFCTQLNSFKYSYLAPIILFIICLHTLNWFQVLLSNTNNFIYTHLNGFNNYFIRFTIQFYISHLF